MPAVFVNMGTVLVGSLLGILLKNRLRESLQNAVMTALGLCTALIGISSAIGTADVLCVIICMALGTAIGELLRIHDRIESVGDVIKTRLLRGKASGSRFTEGFVSACILFCVGSMTIMGSLEAGIHGDYSIIFAKSALDFVSSMAFGAAMGIGVTFSVFFILVFQGGLTLLAAVVAPYLSAAVVTEMSAVGGVILMGMAVNMLALRKEPIRVANMLPCIFLPLAYLPLSAWIGNLF
ncbi:MAG: DUF554 domain-containing protein [Oscillospiraceae bacterium]|nr:DUF554 domain-containing protein [Oscillospiraceae bacterium]